jgi:hypothetical protein
MKNFGNEQCRQRNSGRAVPCDNHLKGRSMTTHTPALKNAPEPEAISAAKPQTNADADKEQMQLVARLKEACFEWVSQVSRMQQLDLAFAIRLASCRRPGDAATLCGEWMAHRVDSAVCMQHRLLGLWLDANTAAIAKQADHPERSSA